MKRRALLLLGFLAASAASAFENEPDGFRGIEWNAPVESAGELVAVDRDKRLAVYRRRADRLSIGEAELRSIHYSFYVGRFQGVLIESKPGTENKAALRAAFHGLFGEGHRRNQFLDHWVWAGEKALISLDCSRDTCTAGIMSKEVLDAVRQDREAAAADAKKDF